MGPSSLLPLTSTEVLEAEHLLDQWEMQQSPATLAQLVTAHDSEHWLPYRHLLYVNEHIMRLVDREDPLTHLLITLPFRHGKSLFCSTYLPAWYLNRFPDRRIILTSYADEFAEKWGRDVRTLIDSRPELFKIRISKASSAANRWDVEGHRGGMKTAGVGGQLIGWGAHLFVIDDPVKDDAEAQSLIQRDAKWRWWNTAAQSRLEPGGVVLVDGTRYHEDDFIGRLLSEQKTVEEGGVWTHINLPALAEANDALGRKPGEALCPERYDENALANIQKLITTSAWLSGYQQRPTPEGGGRFKESLFKYWTHKDFSEDKSKPLYSLEAHAADLAQESFLIPREDCGRFIIIDTALTVKSTSDYTVAGVFDVAGWTDPSRLILSDLKRLRLEGADHLSWVQGLNETYRPTWIGIEETSISLTLIQQCLRAGLPIRRIKPERDKYGRSESAVILLQSGRMYFPQTAPWLQEFRSELLSFPASTHDDQVDVISYGAREFSRGYGVKAHAKDPGPQTHEERVWDNARRASRHRRSTIHPMLGSGF